MDCDHAHVRHGCVVRDRGGGGLHDHGSLLFPFAHDQDGDHGEDHGDVDRTVLDVHRRQAPKQVVTVAWVPCPTSLLARARVAVEEVVPSECHALVLVLFPPRKSEAVEVLHGRNLEVVELLQGDRRAQRRHGRGEYDMAFQRWGRPIPREG